MLSGYTFETTIEASIRVGDATVRVPKELLFLREGFVDLPISEDTNAITLCLTNKVTGESRDFELYRKNEDPNQFEGPILNENTRCSALVQNGNELRYIFFEYYYFNREIGELGLPIGAPSEGLGATDKLFAKFIRGEETRIDTPWNLPREFEELECTMCKEVKTFAFNEVEIEDCDWVQLRYKCLDCGEKQRVVKSDGYD